MVRLNRISVVVLASILVMAFMAAELPNIAAAQNVRDRLLQKQQQMIKEKIIQQQKKALSTGTLPTPAKLTDTTAKNKDKYKEADDIYRNLRKAQKVSHTSAIEALKQSGFPTDKIVRIP